LSGRTEVPAGARELIRGAVLATLRSHEVPRARIALQFVSDEQMAEMNEGFLGHHGPTDVLTFDSRDEKSNDNVEGDIALCVDVARREAENHGHKLEAELALYAVHGVLHLLNYSDSDEHAAAEMHGMEDRILESLGVGAVYHSLRQ